MARFFEVKPGRKCPGKRIKRCGKVWSPSGGIYKCWCYRKRDLRRK